MWRPEPLASIPQHPDSCWSGYRVNTKPTYLSYKDSNTEVWALSVFWHDYYWQNFALAMDFYKQLEHVFVCLVVCFANGKEKIKFKSA